MLIFFIMKIQLSHKFEDIISVENLLEAWKEFIRGKRDRRDVCEFSLNLMDNIFSLHGDLLNHTYNHGHYQSFKISDPKPRDIHKASVRDRLLHHAIYRVLYPYFDRKFIFDFYSCRIDKGTHRAMNRFRDFAQKTSRNHTKTCWVLKCDIRKFFASIDHEILKEILGRHIDDSQILWLLGEVIDSFYTDGKPGVGLPLGNLTSQLFVNIFMNEFDQFIKHGLKILYYIRYADDFVILDTNRMRLEKFIPKIAEFLEQRLKLLLHSDKVIIKTFASGVDLLGWVHFPHHRVLRTSTKWRMYRRLKQGFIKERLSSYLGLLKHGNTHKLSRTIQKINPLTTIHREL